jgi:hypothetical protein
MEGPAAGSLKLMAPSAIDTRMERNVLAVHDFRLQRLRRWSELLDRAFRVPGTKVRFGWDSIIGLVPGFGDAVGAVMSGAILLEAFRFRIPGVVRVRMLLNLLIDLGVGAIPVLGDLFDFAWKANVKNMALLERHALAPGEVRPGDWVFVLGVVAVMLLAVALPFLLLASLVELTPAGLVPSGPSWQIL